MMWCCPMNMRPRHRRRKARQSTVRDRQTTCQRINYTAGARLPSELGDATRQLAGHARGRRGGGLRARERGVDHLLLLDGIRPALLPLGGELVDRIEVDVEGALAHRRRGVDRDAAAAVVVLERVRVTLAA